ncbi:MAG: hypothetical protein IE886_07100 [Campylobacterales bacterium]|nr:hypothetical protein [Campylobacterales bacterium]
MNTTPDTFPAPIGQEKAASLLRSWLQRIGSCRHFGGVADLLVIAAPPASGKNC